MDSSIPCTHSAYNRDSSVNRPILNCITIADNRFKNGVQKFTAYAYFLAHRGSIRAI